MSTTKSNFAEALIAKYDYQYKEALAHLNLYMSNSVGIGEHSDLLDECDKFVKQMVDASDNKKMIEKWLSESS
jgi:hypothetical protein